MKRGLKNNTFDRAWCHNKASDDLEARVYFMSDPSHLIKKYCNHFEKSFESSSRRLRLPTFLVQLVLRSLEPSGPAEGFSIGEECFMRVFGRLYELTANSRQPPYYHGTAPIGTADPRIDELQDILAFVRTWFKFTQEAYPAKERASHFLSHQLYFDTQMMIEGFVGLLTYLEARDGVICVIARKLNQHSLESLFGQLRFNCGSGRDPSMFKTIHAMSRVETQRVVRRGVRYAQARRRNSGQTGDSEPCSALERSPPKRLARNAQDSDARKLACALRRGDCDAAGRRAGRGAYTVADVSRLSG